MRQKFSILPVFLEKFKTKTLAFTFMSSDLFPLQKDPGASEGFQVILIYS